mgnify:FL=1
MRLGEEPWWGGGGAVGKEVVERRSSSCGGGGAAWGVTGVEPPVVEWAALPLSGGRCR